MRRYYSAGYGQKSVATQSLGRAVDHWELLSTYVRGTASLLGFDTVASCISACNKRNADQLFNLCSKLDDHLKVYDGRTDLRLVRAERQLVCLLKKYPFPKHETTENPKANAEFNLRQAEEQCKLANEKIKNASLADMPSWVPRAKLLIESVLGPLTPEVIMNIITNGTHGPGATLNSRDNRTTPYYKYMDLPYTCTKRALPYAYAAMSSSPRWLDLLESSGMRKTIPPLGCPQYQKELTLFDHCVEIVTSDKITFVPKDAKKDRPIAIGSSLNMYLQLGVKSFMQKRLKTVGVDLSDQTRNQRMAFAGSRYAYCNGCENPNQYSTIDLSNASDTVSIEIVRLLLDPLWFSFLWDLRFDSGDLRGETISYEKFSAMGNGFTFPLESLVFWAIAKATCQEINPDVATRDIAVYGDDIIVRRWAAEQVCASLKWAGFSINEEKSFIAGHFKESCGADFFRGHNVRPFYLKRVIKTLEDVYFVCNSIADLVCRDGSMPGMTAIYQYLFRLIPRNRLVVLPLSSDSDFGLRLPLDLVSSYVGSRPFLSENEFNNLQLEGVIHKDERYINTSPYTWALSYSALRYKNRSRTRLMLALEPTRESQPEPFSRSARDAAVDEASSMSQVTRRNAVTVVISVGPCPNWDGVTTIDDSRRHPARWIHH